MLKRRLAKLEQAVNGVPAVNEEELKELEEVPLVKIGGEISEELRAKMQRKRELLRNVDPSKLEFKVVISPPS